MALVKNIIQVAGLHDLAEAHSIIQAGANFLGFPLCLTAHTPDLSENTAANIITALPTTVNKVLITYLNNAYNIKRLASFLRVNYIQLHSDINILEIAKIKRFLPQIKIIKSIIIRDSRAENYISFIKHYSPHVDAFILDTYDPITGTCGATGKTHDWQVSRYIVTISPRPVILAGGLNPENITEAILTVRPAGVDVHSGVEGKDGRKDITLLKSFIDKAKMAFATINQIIA
jgi:phosphoribosylanthranilate isomerase